MRQLLLSFGCLVSIAGCERPAGTEKAQARSASTGPEVPEPGRFEFAGLAWGSDSAAVQARLQEHGFALVDGSDPTQDWDSSTVTLIYTIPEGFDSMGPSPVLASDSAAREIL